MLYLQDLTRIVMWFSSYMSILLGCDFRKYNTRNEGEKPSQYIWFTFFCYIITTLRKEKQNSFAGYINIRIKWCGLCRTWDHIMGMVEWRVTNNWEVYWLLIGVVLIASRKCKLDPSFTLSDFIYEFSAISYVVNSNFSIVDLFNSICESFNLWIFF